MAKRKDDRTPGGRARFAGTVFPIMLLALGSAAGGAEAADAPSSCEVTRLVGQVTLQREGTTMALSPNVLLYERDRITTGDASKVEIRCEDGSTIVVGDRSTVSLATFATPPAAQRGWTGVLSMIEGIMRITLPGTRRWNRLESVTNTAVASARSTAWIVDAKPDTTGVFAIEGRVGVVGRTAPGEVTLTVGEGTDVRRGQPPTQPVTWGRPRVTAAMARTALP